MKKTLFIILMFITFLVFADGGSKESKTTMFQLTGVILDSITNESLVGVEVEIGGKKIYTDLDGKFTTIIYPGEHNIKTSYISYKSDSIKINQNKDLIILMSQD